MKTINAIIVAIVLILVIFVVRNNYKSIYSIYSDSMSSMQNSIDSTSSIAKSQYKDKLNGTIDTLGNTVVGNTANKSANIKAPGALVVSESFLSNNAKSISLSSKNVIAITNKERKDNGNLAPLTENAKLDFSAEKKLQDMFVKGYFEHISPAGVGVADLGTEVGYEYIIIGENLAMGNFKDDQSLVDAWMASPGHKANILNNRYTEIGVSVGKGNYNGKTIWMAVQHFALPKSACPVISEVLHGMIDFDQKKIKEMEVDLTSRKAKIDKGQISEGMTTNGQIDKYNSLVKDYNNLILDIKEKINNYNEQVRSFNNCIEGI